MKVDIFNTEKKYQIIYADPPWTYEKSGGTKNSRGLAKAHYKTMSIEEICNLPVKNITTDDAMLFIWVTFPQLEKVFQVMKAWGFEYYGIAFDWLKMTANWKIAFGMGYYTRQNTEVCLIGVKKKRIKPIVRDISSVIVCKNGEHSKKPDEARNKIVAILGDRPRIELFARQQVQGWDCWGDEL